MKQYKFANVYLKLPDVGKDLYASTDYFPRGVKDAQQLVSQENYYARVILRTYYVYNDLNIIDTDTILDIGPGLGDISKNFSDIVKKVYCCDINQSLLNMAEMNCQHKSNMSFHPVDNLNKPLYFLDDNSITKAFAYSVLVHCNITTITNYFKELKRVLKKDGLFLTQCCIAASHHIYFPIDEEELKKIINESNFNIIIYRKFTVGMVDFPGTDLEPVVGDPAFVGVELLLSKE
jgi:SAM-dependent methyltransferase